MQNSALPNLWQQGAVIPLTITDLSDNGDGVGRFEGRVVFVPDTVPGDELEVRLVRVKPGYAHAQLLLIMTPSPHRVRPSCMVADKCGGCQWQPVSYDYQLQAKQNQVVQALERIGGFDLSSAELSGCLSPILAAPEPLRYRNKVTYPLDERHGKVRAGYYRKGTHRLVNLNHCPVQDLRLDPLLAQVKQDIQQRGWTIYNEKTHRGLVRHLSLRVGRRTGEMLLTLVVRNWDLEGLEDQAHLWLRRYPGLVGVTLNRNPERTNAIFGSETRTIAGRDYLEESFADLRFQIRPDTFFQVYTEQAEALMRVIQDHLKLEGNETLVDAYCGIGTMTLPLARQVRQAIGIEVQPEAVAQAQTNAKLNNITNVSFQTGTVESLLPQLGFVPDVVLIDPPRKGCDASVLAQLRLSPAKHLVYVSCNPATLARDLQQLCRTDEELNGGHYKLRKVQPADFFPQTAHVESVAFLERAV
ncbi:23S rRNA (uracil(1939)-C(5))-methyltransferase RlmD [Leptolyngbya sp. FACHB-261]|uniref:23S rRNA (uracil(1939)-C(5))-methyltransferase RlmD n=1 Tax=Leptolyngbya sp. FACHB-261 TaxID=2692806 RepID=UPI001686E195|nr:23S rRNA (uracil(1939)-C(5))-methyltransferase RlmD [Leptolyngbya sp. FACHB-261]MBD2101206.1 23S rRNA (uracil(1939)-C(5))-methyltransferase RlmD [Leptolyngbya sp. FACHB-261]